MKKVLKTVIFTFVFAVAIAINSKVEAATASIAAKPKTITVGESVTITVNINAAAWNLNVSGEISDSIVGMNMDGENESTIKTYKITPEKPGKYNVYLKGDITDEKSEDPTDISKSVTINVEEKETEDKKEEDTKEEDTKEEDKIEEIKLSDDATLSTLGVTPKEYDFTGFKKTKTEYSVTIPNEVDSLRVAYKTSDSRAKVKITGNTNLEVGTSTIKVVVTAEDGKTTKTYKIKVTKLAAEEEKPGNIIDEEENEIELALDSLEIKGITLSPEFSSDVYSYEATVNMDNNDLKKLEITAQPNQYGAEVEISGNTNLVEGENLVNIIVKSDYLKEQVVYQIVINKVSQLSEIVPDNNDFIKKEHLIIGAFILSVILIVVLIYINYRKNKDVYKDEDDNEKEDESIGYTNLKNENLVEELFNKKKISEDINNIDRETMKDIQKENDRIFKKNEDITTEFSENSTQANEEDPFLRELRERRKKGKH